MNLLLHNIPVTFYFLAKIENYNFVGESHPLTQGRCVAQLSLVFYHILPSLCSWQHCVECLSLTSTSWFPPVNSEMLSQTKHIQNILISPFSPKLD